MVFIIIISLFIVGTILYAIFGKIAPLGWEKKQFIKLVFVIEGISLLIAVSETYLLVEDPNIILKPNPGKQNVSEERILNSEGMAEDYVVAFDVPSRKLTEGEIKDVFEKAKLEIDSTFLGENKDVDHIENKVVMNTSYQEGLVAAEWRLGSYAYIYTDGTLKNEQLDAPVICTAEVYLTYENYGEIYSFSFSIVPKSKTPLEQFIDGIKGKFLNNIDETSTDEIAYLPDEYEGHSLVWEKKKTMNGITVLVIGVIVLFGLGYGRTMDEKKKEKERRDLLELEYSDMLSTLALLLGAGMSVRKAWEKMVLSAHQRAGPLLPIYEEMGITLHQMQTGKSEKTSIEEFGKRTRLPCYRKMSGILINYIQKGSRDITIQLNNEVILAFEERKSLAKLAGELAGTKLLLPMLMQLGIALVIIIVPAILSFSF